MDKTKLPNLKIRQLIYLGNGLLFSYSLFLLVQILHVSNDLLSDLIWSQLRRIEFKNSEAFVLKVFDCLVKLASVQLVVNLWLICKLATNQPIWLVNSQVHEDTVSILLEVIFIASIEHPRECHVGDDASI